MCVCSNSVAKRREHGTVLIMALLIVAVVAGLSIKFASDYQLGLTRAENRWHGQQARAYLQGVESLAITFLKEDDPAVDYLGEGWDTEVPYEIEGGWLAGALTDASSRFNLNSLNTPFVPEKPGNSHERYSEPQRRFIRLLQCIPETPLSLDEAVAVLEAIVDWMDPDDEDSGFGGAEAFFYQSAEIPYRPANGPFVSFDELRMVRYMTPQLMLWLNAYTTVLPGQEGTNINTMPPLLMRTLNAAEQLEPLSEQDAQQLVDSLPEAGFYADISELSTTWDLVVGNGTLDTAGLTVKTNYFWLRTQVSLVNQERIMQSLLIRNGADIRVMRRSDGF